MEEQQKVAQQLWFADKIAKFSKDTSTKVGAVIFNERGTSPISFGYNGMPRGLNDNHPERSERPEKYSWYEHAERNAIYNVAREFLTGKIIICSHFPNMESARAIVSSGITSVIVDKASINESEKDTQRAMELFSETGVKVITPDLSKFTDTFEDFCKANRFDTLTPLTSELSSALEKYNKDAYSQFSKYKNYITLVKEYGEEHSPDREKKSACMILNEKTFAPIAVGVNSPPMSLTVTEEMHAQKQFWFQEPEKNAIFDVVYDKLKKSQFEVTWCPCIKCGLSIVSVGAAKVKTRAPDFTKEADLRWKTDFDQSQILFAMSGIEVEYTTNPISVPKRKP